MCVIWTSKHILLSVKLRIYKTGVWSKLTYGSEAWDLDDRVSLSDASAVCRMVCVKNRRSFSGQNKRSESSPIAPSPSYPHSPYRWYHITPRFDMHKQTTHRNMQSSTMSCLSVHACAERARTTHGWTSVLDVYRKITSIEKWVCLILTQCQSLSSTEWIVGCLWGLFSVRGSQHANTHLWRPVMYPGVSSKMGWTHPTYVSGSHGVQGKTLHIHLYRKPDDLMMDVPAKYSWRGLDR